LQLAAVSQRRIVMMGDPHRSSVEIQPLVEGGSLAGAVLFADGAATHGEDTTAGPRTRFEHATVISDFAELVCRRHPGQSGAEYHDTDTRYPASQIEARLCRGGEQAEAGHRLVRERSAARCRNTCQEPTSREIHPASSIGC
jgi:hypothetical protein